MKTTLVKCIKCDKEFFKNNKEIRRSPNHFCSRSCSNSYNNTIKPKRQVEGNCKTCNKLIPSVRTYCDFCYQQKIELRHLNKIKKLKIKKEPNKCIDCKKITSCKRCIKCYHTYKRYNTEDTIADIQYHEHHRSACYARIRSRARSIAKSLNWNSCRFCGYNKHIEIAHIKSISSYSIDTQINIVNHPSNLIPLCRNCHWELDHNLIKLK